jgi:hypothetical protein
MFSNCPPHCGEKRSWSTATGLDLCPLDRELHKLEREKRRLLRRDRRNRVKRVSLLATSYLEAGQLRNAYDVIRGWYRQRSGNIPKPTNHDLERISQEYASLYSAIPLSNDPLPINVEPSCINDNPPTEDEILNAIHHIKRGK